jgi:predicted aldo/keto reductase-like oxidoreductase
LYEGKIMKYRPLGKNKQSVSIIGLGTEYLEMLPSDEVIRTIHAAMDAGVNIMDFYNSNPQYRDTVGRALKDRRGKMLIQGHMGPVWVTGQYGRSRDTKLCLAHIEDLLKRLDTDYLDILMLHWLDKRQDIDQNIFADGGFFEAALELKRQGKVRYLGFSSHEVGAANYVLQRGGGAFDALMFSINPYHDLMSGDTDIEDQYDYKNFGGLVAGGRNSDRAELYQHCAREDIALFVMKPFAAGHLLSKRSPFGPLTVCQCLHYALTRPGVTSVLPGVGSMAHLEEALDYLDSTEKQRDLSQLLLQKNWALSKGICMYCNHCLPCPSRIDIGAVQSLNDLWVEGDAAKQQSLKEQYEAINAKASQCTACGSCEKACPFGVTVIGKMRQAAERFES